MSDEVEITDADWEAARNAWEAACLQDLYYTPVEGVDLLQMPEGRIALALTQRHAAGYQAAIADVVEWLREQPEPPFTRRHRNLAAQITRRFGKGQDHG